MAFAEINDLIVHYQVTKPGGPPPLLFINSLGSDLRIWDDVVAHFGDRFVIRYDKRGHGLTDCPPGPYTIDGLADDVVGLLNYLGVAKVIPIGISVGGMIALSLAARYPARVARLVVSNTGAVIGTADYWAARIATLEATGFAELGEAIVGRWFGPTFCGNRPVYYRGYHNMLIRTPLTGYIATCAAIRDADLRETVRSMTVPTLVLCGAEDQATPPALSQELVALLPTGRFHLIPHAAHLPCIEQPQLMAQAIAEFIKE